MGNCFGIFKSSGSATMSTTNTDLQCSVCCEELLMDSVIVLSEWCRCDHLLCLDCALAHYIQHQRSSCPFCLQVSKTLLVTTITHQKKKRLNTNNNNLLLLLYRVIYHEMNSHEWTMPVCTQLDGDEIRARIKKAAATGESSSPC